MIGFLILAGLDTTGAKIDPRDVPPFEEVFRFEATASAPGRISIHWQVADGYYLYRNALRVEDPRGFTLRRLDLPPATAHSDEFFGEIEVYRGETIMSLEIDPVPGSLEAVFELHAQGCADIGLCYPPQRITVRVGLGNGPHLSPPPPRGESGSRVIVSRRR